MSSRIAFAGAALLALLLAPPPVARAESKPAELRATDALGRPGRAVKLRAKLQRKGFMGINPDVKGEPLDFYLVGEDGRALEEARFLGTGETSKDGDAELDWTPSAPGQFDVEARIRRGSSYVALPAPLVVAVPPPERGVILVQVDGTVSQATNLTMFRGKPNDQIPQVDGAAVALRTLAQHYQLVYLTGLDETFTTKFRDWLALRQIPRAPVVFWDLFSRSLSHASYMEQLVTRLKRELPQVSVGIGAQASDGALFLGQGMAAVVLGASGELPDEVLPARRWDEALVHVALIHRSGALVREVASADPARSEAARAELGLLGRPGLGYVHRFRSDADPNVAAAATLVAGGLRANEAFFRALDVRTANAALTSLLAAWRHGERAVVSRLYADRKVGLSDPIPTFRRCELVSRNEPEPGKVLFKVRLRPDEGEPTEREVLLLRGEDGAWRVDVRDF
ncbi:MAG: hypothetical protein M9894_39125 [Planctomycetes bacterium]|nr:hypothetical protein [Planctomycetota bacterium]